MMHTDAHFLMSRTSPSPISTPRYYPSVSNSPTIHRPVCLLRCICHVTQSAKTRRVQTTLVHIGQQVPYSERVWQRLWFLSLLITFITRVRAGALSSIVEENV